MLMQLQEIAPLRAQTLPMLALAPERAAPPALLLVSGYAGWTPPGHGLTKLPRPMQLLAFRQGAPY